VRSCKVFVSHAGQEKKFEIQLPRGPVHFSFQLVEMSLTALHNLKHISMNFKLLTLRCLGLEYSFKVFFFGCWEFC